MENLRAEEPLADVSLLPPAHTAPLPEPGSGKSALAALKPLSHFIAGASGGLVTAFATSPLDVLRTRLQSDFYQTRSSLSTSHRPAQSIFQFRETFNILSFIYRSEGWRGLFRGLGPNLVGVVPASAIKFYTYGNIKRFVTEKGICDENAVLGHMLAAGSAGVFTSTCTNPIWLVKTRLQLDRSRTDSKGALMQRRYKNSLDCLAQVIRQEGFRGLYRGVSASYLGAVETTMHLALYEQLKLAVAKHNEAATARGDDSAAGRAMNWFGASGAAGLSKLGAVLVCYPHEVARTRLRQAPMQNGLVKYSGIAQCFRLIAKEEGFAALYGGLTPHLLRAIPSAAITLGVYELVLRLFDMVE